MQIIKAINIDIDINIVIMMIISTSGMIFLRTHHGPKNVMGIVDDLQEPAAIKNCGWALEFALNELPGDEFNSS